MDEIKPTAHFPGWEIVRKIGQGSFGTVYEIRREQLGREERAALKRITLPQNEGDVDDLYGSGYTRADVVRHYRSCLEDVLQEYYLMAEMKGHTNVVNCEDVSYVAHEDGIGYDIYIRMELLTPLMKVLSGTDSGADEEELAVRLGKDISRALMLCRQKNIVHRDIKPQNIFVSENGDFKLGDFGIARTMERTTGGTKTGTYNYMAPEVYNNQDYGSQVDIYSLGMLLYWLLNERRGPFLPLPPKAPTARQMDEARDRRFKGELLPPPAHGSEALKKIVLRACAYRPEERTRTAQELYEALDRLVPVTRAPRPTQTARTPQTTRATQTTQATQTAARKADHGWICPVCDTKNSDNDSVCQCCQTPRRPEPKPRKQAVPALICAALLVLALVIGGAAILGGQEKEKPAVVSPSSAPIPSESPVSAKNKCGEKVWWELEDGVLTISGSGAMGEYDFNDYPWREQRDEIKTVVIENGVTSIGSDAFLECRSLASVTIPDSVTEIGECAFEGCSSLTGIRIPKNVTKLNYATFMDCDNLTSVILPSGLTVLGDAPFSGCSSLTDITIPDSVTETGVSVFHNCSSLTSIEIPNGMTTINGEVFSGCSSLAQVSIPDSVTEIGYAAFNECTSLTKLTIPNSVKVIGESAFYKCSGLTQVTIPDSVTEIGMSAFAYCSSLASVMIPISVMEIGDLAFIACDRLTIHAPEGSYAQSYAAENDIPFAATTAAPAPMSAENKCGENAFWTLENGTLTISGSGEMEDYPSNATPWKAYNGEIKALVVEEGITSLGDGAFYSCGSLSKVTLPDSLTEIGSAAFAQCKSLTNIVLPDGVTKLSGRVFAYCESLTGITLPAGLKKIDDRAFFYCESLTSIVLPDGVKTLGDRVFYGCSNLTSITIPASVTTILTFTDNDQLTIRAPEGSVAQSYAEENSYPYEAA